MDFQPPKAGLCICLQDGAGNGVKPGAVVAQEQREEGGLSLMIHLLCYLLTEVINLKTNFEITL